MIEWYWWVGYAVIGVLVAIAYQVIDTWVEGYKDDRAFPASLAIGLLWPVAIPMIALMIVVAAGGEWAQNKVLECKEQTGG